MPKFKKENTLHGLFVTKLKALLDVENQLVKALPKMAKKATDPDLRMAFEEHLEETKHQAERLTQSLEGLGEKAKVLKSDAIRGLVADTEWCIKNVEEGPALDACLIASAQYVEHFEMAGYGAAVEWAKLMGHTEAETVLNEILEEEKAADEKLNDLAVSKINAQVAQGMEEESEEE